MLILDVVTRWSSTHQMLERALLYRKAIDAYIYKNKDMRAYDLSEEEWKALERVASWL
ncbi:hypothetical protein SISSUDRAFT_971950, partial [Sistotremastrum suecicum HHB10207 ss-3]